METRTINEHQEMLPTTVVEGGGRVVLDDSPEEPGRLYSEVVADPDISVVVAFIPCKRFEQPGGQGRNTRRRPETGWSVFRRPPSSGPVLKA
ncbi:MAG TPA: hypothetical protein PLI76_06130 [Methanoculleus sp.]|nr:hypothetical protein [Methanoculleus sp.]